MADYEEETASKKLAGFIEKNKKVFIAILIVLVCCLIGYIVFASVAKSNKAKNLQALDEISYELTSKSSDLEDAEVEARIATAMEKAIPLTEIQYANLKKSQKVPEGYILAVGDNYAQSFDSRNYGFVSVKNILGKIICR